MSAHDSSVVCMVHDTCRRDPRGLGSVLYPCYTPYTLLYRAWVPMSFHEGHLRAHKVLNVRDILYVCYFNTYAALQQANTRLVSSV